MSSKYGDSTRKQYLIYIINDATYLLMLWWWGVPFVIGLTMFTMKTALVFVVFCALSCDGAMLVRSEDDNVHNNRPIIGVLSQEQAYQLKDQYAKENYTSYIAASYVKSIESSGARVVPIMIGKSRQYYRSIMGKLNGVLFPGGMTYFNQSNGYADAGQHIYEIAQELNDVGDYFPIFGTCLGFELLVILASGRGDPENRVMCKSVGNIPLKFTEDFRKSKMFQKIDNELVRIMEQENSTVNNHQFCIVDENIKKFNLTNDWRVTSHSSDANGLEFISSIEHKRYPFYGIQFHPEKTAFEWKRSSHFAHSYAAIKANRYMIDFFVEECRRNIHTFSSEQEENQYLIYNYKPHFTGADGNGFTQCYFFEPKGIVSD